MNTVFDNLNMVKVSLRNAVFDTDYTYKEAVEHLKISFEKYLANYEWQSSSEQLLYRESRKGKLLNITQVAAIYNINSNTLRGVAYRVTNRINAECFDLKTLTDIAYSFDISLVAETTAKINYINEGYDFYAYPPMVLDIMESKEKIADDTEVTKAEIHDALFFLAINDPKIQIKLSEGISPSAAREVISKLTAGESNEVYRYYMMLRGIIMKNILKLNDNIKENK